MRREEDEAGMAGTRFGVPVAVFFCAFSSRIGGVEAARRIASARWMEGGAFRVGEEEVVGGCGEHAYMGVRIADFCAFGSRIGGVEAGRRVASAGWMEGGAFRVGGRGGGGCGEHA
jgi:hypothetical protein